jgi:parvulin-like peptidyl-prolyl isomerase
VKRALVTLTAVAMLAGTSCGNLLSPAAAIVNGKKITIDEVEEALQKFLPSEQHDVAIQQGEDPIGVQRHFEQFYLTHMVRLRVLEEKAEELGVTPTKEEIDAGVKEASQEFGDTFDKVLARVGLDGETIRAFVTSDLIEVKLKKKITAPVVPTEADLREFYDSHRADYTRTRASQIVVSDEQLAEELAGRLREAAPDKVGSLFETLARKYSIDESTAGKGGDLGFLTLGEVPTAIEDAVLGLEPGDVSDVVESSGAFIILEVTDQKVQPFEQARDAIEALIGSPAIEQTWRDYVIAAYKDADVKVNPRYGELDLQTQEIVNASSANVPGVDAGSTPAPTAPALLTPLPSPS